MKFRPCIDLHNGKVKQIVGGSLTDEAEPETNFVSDRSPAWYAELYRDDHLTRGHVIKLGPDNDEAACEALAAWPEGLQIGGGITAENATKWLDAGAAPDELMEIEDRLVLVTVESIDPDPIDVPRRLVNHIQEERWHG